MTAYKDETGNRYGRLLVMSKADGMRRVSWKCKCDCGNTVIVPGIQLRCGKTKSCGCLHKEITAKKNAERLTKHGDARTRLYGIFIGMHKRCEKKYHTAYGEYGGRNIKVCDEWSDYSTFKEWALENGYSDSLTIDRIDNNKGYSPDNCRWSTMKEQSNNKRSSRIIECNGERHTVAEWSEILNIPYVRIAQRLRRGWPVEKALSQQLYR